MSQDSTTRRDLIRGGAAATGTALLGSLAGCGSLLGGGGGGNVPAPSATVPASAEAMVTMDFAGMINDADMKEMGNTLLGRISEAEGYSGPENVDAALDDIENEAGLDPRNLSGGTAFTKVDGADASDEYNATVIETDWTESELITALEESGTSYSEGSYEGKTTYTPEPSTGSILGVLEEGRFALGRAPAVEDAIDVSVGNTDPVSGALLENFESATDGYMEFASVIPASQLPDTDGGGGPQIRGLDELQGISGSLYKSGGNFGMEMNMHTGSDQAASDLSESLEDLTGVASMATDDPNVLTAVDRIQFSASGSTATVSYEESIAQVKEYVEQYAAQLVGAGFGGETPLAVDGR